MSAKSSSHDAGLRKGNDSDNESSSSDGEDSMIYDNDDTQSLSSIEQTMKASCNQEHLQSAKQLIISQQMGYNSGLNTFVNKELWRATKFMAPNNEFKPTCPLARFCYSLLHIAENQQALWWKNTWSQMKKVLSKKRTSITQRMMDAFLGTIQVLEWFSELLTCNSGLCYS